jgi:2,4-dienoyl-CoA reductase-like NADH-dependent reductase (Old Yellow Enzyme family)
MKFVIPGGNVPWGTQAFLAPIAQRVRREAGLPVAAGWCMDDPVTAERVVADGQMDLVMIGRAHLANPHFPHQIALALDEPRPAEVLPSPYAYWLSRYKGPGRASAQ